MMKVLLVLLVLPAFSVAIPVSMETPNSKRILLQRKPSQRHPDQYNVWGEPFFPWSQHQLPTSWGNVPARRNPTFKINLEARSLDSFEKHKKTQRPGSYKMYIRLLIPPLVPLQTTTSPPASTKIAPTATSSTTTTTRLPLPPLLPLQTTTSPPASTKIAPTATKKSRSGFRRLDESILRKLRPWGAGGFTPRAKQLP